MVSLTGCIMQGLVVFERERGNLPHQMLGENLGRESVRLARFALDAIIQSANEVER